MSKLHIHKSSWLLTCSDLFFLLFAFFILNHTLPNKTEPFPEFLSEVRPFAAVLTQDLKPTFRLHEDNNAHPEQELFYTVDRSWFDDTGDITLQGNAQIQTIEKLLQVQDSSVRVSLFLPEVYEKNEDIHDVSVLYENVIKKLSRTTETIVSTAPDVQQPRIILSLEYSN